MHFAKILLLPALLLALAGAGAARADNIGPAQEQEYADAKSALEAARKAQAEKYAAVEFKQAQSTLDGVRQTQDATRFSEASRLARAQAELAAALGELGVESEKLAAANAALQKAKDELASLAKPQETRP